MEEHRTYGNPRLVYGWDLRVLLTLAIHDSRRSVSVADLVRMVEGIGAELGGRPSKVVSDALRAELRKGRVVRERRGVYRAGHIPRSTHGRLRRRAQAVHARIGAAPMLTATPRVAHGGMPRFRGV